jgi:D-xylose transport system substrate-binding protein
MKKPATCTLVILAAFLMAAFPVSGKEQPIKIGLSISDFETERWPVEEAIMRRLAAEQGAELISQVANHDAGLQNRQIANMVLLGADAIIVIAEDGTTAAAAVAAAADSGIPCIAYDRLIKSDKLAAYISFDNLEVGRIQARGILAVVNSGNFAMLGGSPTDNNAELLRTGQMEIIQPLVDKGRVKIVADQWVENWAPSNATKIMEDILIERDNKIDAVVASNDGTAIGALQAMKAQGLAGRVPISGQDATAAGCRSILHNELTMTVLKDVRLLSPMAIDIAIKLARKERIGEMKDYPLAGLTGDKRLQGSIPCRFLKVVGIDRNNIYQEIVKTGFQKYDDVYRDIPEDKRPPRP